MAIDGILLSKVIDQLHDYENAKVLKISQISDYEIVFTCKNAAHNKFNLFISAHPNTNHISIIDKNFSSMEEPKSFLMLLRKHLEQAVLLEFVQTNYDRFFTITFKTYNNLGDLTVKKLVIELMGKYANMILVDENNIILDALKRIPPFLNQQRIIQPGAAFTPTPTQIEKKDPFTCPQYNPDEPLGFQFFGFSKELSFQLQYLMDTDHLTFAQCMQKIKDSNSLYITSKANKEYKYHCIPLTYISNNYQQMDIFTGLNFIFLEKENQERIKILTNDVTKCINQQYKHLHNKLPKLQQSYQDSLQCDVYRHYGDLIFQSNYQPSGHKQLIAYNYESDKDEVIPLDSKYDSKTNAKKYYQKYSKLKKGQIYIQQQIELCTKQLQYFSDLLEQLEYIDVNGANQMRQELVKLGYVKDKQKNNHKKKKNNKITINSIVVNDIKIYYGKNNYQNEEVTFNTNARKGLWFHAQNCSGAHVLLTDNLDNEELIRLCANIAALFSKYRYSSSVAVQYCPVNTVKKLPKGHTGQVLLGSYKTIYIDPDISLIQKYNL